MSIFNNKLPGDFSRKKNDRVAAAAMRLWLCSWPRLWHLILGGQRRGGKEARKHYHHHHVSIRYTRGWLLFSSQIEQPNSQSEPRPRCSHWAGTQRLLAPHWRSGWTTGGRMEHQSAPPRPHRWWATWNNKQKLGFRQSGEVHHEAPLFLPPKQSRVCHTSQWVWRCTEWKHRFGAVVVRKRSSQIFIQGAPITSNFLGWSPLDQINRYSLENNQRTKTEVLEVSISLFTTTRGSSSIARKPQHLSSMQNPSNTCHIPTMLHTS